VERGRRVLVYADKCRRGTYRRARHEVFDQTIPLPIIEPALAFLHPAIPA